MRYRFWPLIFFLFIIFQGLEASEIKFNGLVQPWFYAAQQHDCGDTTFGFTLRRVRFKPSGSFSKSIQWTLQFGWDKQVARILDAYIDFSISRGIHLQVGQFTVPGTISSSLTSSGKLDLIERPQITQQWSKNSGLSCYRSMGIQIHGTLLKERLTYAFMVSNPKTYGIFTPTLADSEYINENNGLSIWGRIECHLPPGVRFGGFFGSGKDNQGGPKRSSVGAHLFYVNNPFNLKLEYIQGQVTEGENVNKYYGFYAVLGYTIKTFEPIIRYGIYVPDSELADGSGVSQYRDLTLGVNWFYSGNIKIQINYVIRSETITAEAEGAVGNNIFYINFQYSF